MDKTDAELIAHSLREDNQLFLAYEFEIIYAVLNRGLADEVLFSKKRRFYAQMRSIIDTFRAFEADPANSYGEITLQEQDWELLLILLDRARYEAKALKKRGLKRKLKQLIKKLKFDERIITEDGTEDSETA